MSGACPRVPCLHAWCRVLTHGLLPLKEVTARTVHVDPAISQSGDIYAPCTRLLATPHLALNKSSIRLARSSNSTNAGW